MKKKILGAVTAIAITAIVAFNLNVNSDTNELSALTMSNIEALAQGEGGSSGEVTCYDVYNECLFWNCSVIYRCGAPCTTVKADEWSNKRTCKL